MRRSQRLLAALAMLEVMLVRADVCYEPLGCFSQGEPWWTPLRPAPPPQHPALIRTRFRLYTKRGPPSGVVLHTVPREVFPGGSGFDPRRPVVFLVHGMTPVGPAPWLHAVKDALIRREGTNVFLTDWSPGSWNINYLQAVSNGRVVARQIIRVVLWLETQFRVRRRDIHMIGFSLGAHIVAYAAKEMRGVGKITALDPAGPGFEDDPRLRVAKGDALFVEVVHSSARPLYLLGFGLKRPVGDVDFYVNGGAYQPGCSPEESLPSPPTSLKELLSFPVRALVQLLSCSHVRSGEVYLEAIRRSDCIFWARPHRAPARHRCSPRTCAALHMHTERFPARGAFVLPTADRSPYCLPQRRWDEEDTWVKAQKAKKAPTAGGKKKTVKLATPRVRLARSDLDQWLLPNNSVHSTTDTATATPARNAKASASKNALNS